MIRFILTLIVLGLLFGAGYLNQEEMITLHFFGGMESKPFPLYALAGGIFAVGFFLATVYFSPGWIRSILAGRKQSKRIEQLEIDLDRIRSAAAKEESPPFSNPPPE